MGIKDFAKIFEGKIVTKNAMLKRYVGKTLAIDAMIEIHRTFSGMKFNTLRSSGGEFTLHINSILSNSIAMKNINQIWVFDSEYVHKLKVDTVNKRAEQKKKIKNGLILQRKHIEQIKKLLNLLNIPWVVAPDGIQAEHLCAVLTKKGIADAVLTTDTDALLFGATEIIKKVARENKYTIYNLSKLKTDYKINSQDLIKIGVIMGCDFAKKTPRIGAKTVLKKFKTIELTDEQINAFNLFNEIPLIKGLKCHNISKVPFSNKGQLKSIITWLVTDFQFSKKRLKKLLNKLDE